MGCLEDRARGYLSFTQHSLCIWNFEAKVKPRANFFLIKKEEKGEKSPCAFQTPSWDLCNRLLGLHSPPDPCLRVTLPTPHLCSYLLCKCQQLPGNRVPSLRREAVPPPPRKEDPAGCQSLGEDRGDRIIGVHEQTELITSKIPKQTPKEGVVWTGDNLERPAS